MPSGWHTLRSYKNSQVFKMWYLSSWTRVRLIKLFGWVDNPCIEDIRCSECFDVLIRCHKFAKVVKKYKNVIWTFSTTSTFLLMRKNILLLCVIIVIHQTNGYFHVWTTKIHLALIYFAFNILANKPYSHQNYIFQINSSLNCSLQPNLS